MKLSLIIITVLTFVYSSQCNAAELAIQQKHSGYAPACETRQTGVYMGLGFGNDLRGNAAFNYRGKLYGGYQFCNGLKIELRHTSVIGDDDGIDLNGDHENDVATSENTLNIEYTLWPFK
jgi:hypothetical protein